MIENLVFITIVVIFWGGAIAAAVWMTNQKPPVPPTENSEAAKCNHPHGYYKANQAICGVCGAVVGKFEEQESAPDLDSPAVPNGTMGKLLNASELGVAPAKAAPGHSIRKRRENAK